MDELLPCPFCGGAAEIVGHADGTGEVRCTTRACSVVFVSHSIERSLERWNRRPPPPATDEAAYVAGGNAVWRTLLDLAIKNLGGEEQDKHGWRRERADAVAALRRICERHGDNDWPDDAHLGDVLTKHLEDHMEAP